MKVFFKFTRCCLKENRTRTIVTIIGIMLSMSLFTAVTEGAYSGIKYLQNCEIEGYGNWQGYLAHISQEQLDKISKDEKIKNWSTCPELGWAVVSSKNVNKPYLRLYSIDKKASDMIGVHLVKGRMPENEREILIPTHLYSNGGMRLELGENLRLDVGIRSSGGYELEISNPFGGEEEEIVKTVEKNYTVVGFYERLSDSIEPIACPGYFAFTAKEDSDYVSCFIELKKAADCYEYMNTQKYTDQWTIHSALLMFLGYTKYSRVNSMIYGLAMVLIALIMFGSISLIYNSFAISVSERTKLFGILKSVGATKKQIRTSILYEAVLLSAVGIPMGILVGCGGIGTTLWFLRDAFKGFYATGGETQMRLYINAGAILIAAGICFITTIISADIPARKAMRISPIESIRQSKEIRIRRRSVRTLPIVKTLFGLEGLLASKNFKRNKKRYRSVVISLVVSITLFISASSFCAYLEKSLKGYMASTEDADIVFYYAPDEYGLSPEELLKNFMEIPDMRKGAYSIKEYKELLLSYSQLDDSYKDAYGINENDKDVEFNIGLYVNFVDDEEFAETCKKNGVDVKAYFDKKTPKALLYNTAKVSYQDENEEQRWGELSLYNEDAVPECIMEYEIGDTIKETAFSTSRRQYNIVYPMSMKETVLSKEEDITYTYEYVFKVDNHAVVYEKCKKMLESHNLNTEDLVNYAARHESRQMMITVVDIFSYGFIILMSLIALANVFNTIATSIGLRRREFAMLRSVGLSERGFRKTMNYECIIYGVKALLWGLPASFIVTYQIYRIIGIGYGMKLYIPWYSIVIAIISVFIVIFATMWYATKKIKEDNVIDALKNENL